MAPLLFPARLSLALLVPPSASTDRCFLQLNSSRAEASLTKIRCTFPLHTLGLVQWLSPVAEHRSPLQGGTLNRLAPTRSREPEPLLWWQAPALSGSPKVQRAARWRTAGVGSCWPCWPRGAVGRRPPSCLFLAPWALWELLSRLRAQALQLLERSAGRSLSPGHPRNWQGAQKPLLPAVPPRGLVLLPV